MFLTPLFAETTSTAASSSSSSFLAILSQLAPFILIFVVFYLILILPQKRKQKAHRLMISNLKIGDIIVLNSGIIGKITKIKDNDRLYIKTAEETEIEVLKSFVASIIPE